MPMSRNPASIVVHQVIPKAVDLECHLRVVEVDGVRVIEIRDFIPSEQTYGRGYWIPLDRGSLFSLMNGLSAIVSGDLS